MQIVLADDLLTGHETIDKFNLVLVDKVNALISALKRGLGDNELIDIMIYLESSMAEQFAYEESLHKKYNYSDSETHHADHRNFIEEYREVKHHFKKEGAGFAVSISLMNMIINWLAEHVVEKDRRFIESLKSNT